MGFFTFMNAKMTLQVENPICESGQKFSGKVVLEVKKEIESKGLYLELFQNVKKTSVTNNGTKQTVTEEKLAYITLNDAKIITVGHHEYPFELNTPQINQAEGTLGQVLSFAGNLLQGNKSYFLQARLDIPWGFDKREKRNVQINPRVV